MIRKKLPLAGSAWLILLAVTLLAACSEKTTGKIWLLECEDDAPESCGYVNEQGDIMIDFGKYPMCFTDTFEHYAIVVDQDEGIVAINREEEIMYRVFVYDNGPDYPRDGYFRIIQDKKIGYADVQTGEISIPPKYTAARPFENNYAPVCPDCEEVKDGEYSSWVNGKWGLIDKSGKMALPAKYGGISEVSSQGEALVIADGEEKWVKIN